MTSPTRPLTRFATPACGRFCAGGALLALGVLAGCASGPTMGVAVGGAGGSMGAAIAGAADTTVAAANHTVVETTLRFLPLAGPVATAEAEISGMVWIGNKLVLLPQHPERFTGPDSSVVFVIDEEPLLAALDGTSDAPLQPRRVTYYAPGLTEMVAGYDGLEAVAVVGDRVYFTIEAVQDSVSRGFLISGSIDQSGEVVTVDLEHPVPIPGAVNIPNMSFESLLVAGDHLLALYEANGVNVNPNPDACVFDLDLRHVGCIPSPVVEYRVTDATALDEEGRFWVINYFFPEELGDLQPASDEETRRFGQGGSHAGSESVERLLEMRYEGDRIVRTDTPPVIFELREDRVCRNWEAVVRVAGRGFLLMTDRYPRTLLAFAPYPAE